jgi:hypothetical protein
LGRRLKINAMAALCRHVLQSPVHEEGRR